MRMQPETIDEKAEVLNIWLRYHVQYNTVIDFCDLYGTISLTIRKKGVSIPVFFDMGKTLEKRLDNALLFIDTLKSGNEPGYWYEKA